MIQGICSLLLWLAGFAFVLYGGFFGLLALIANPPLGILILLIVYLVGKNMKF
ncbi:MAG: hypothetical protein ACOYW7_05345 [Nitrospirota bacterium]